MLWVATMKFLILSIVFFSTDALACINNIDAADVEKMVAGLQHGKSVLKCTTKDCICIDGFDLEVSAIIGRAGSKKLVVDSNKLSEKTKRALLQAEEEKAKAELRKFYFDKVKSGSASQEEISQALKYLLEDMRK